MKSYQRMVVFSLALIVAAATYARGQHGKPEPSGPIQLSEYLYGSLPSINDRGDVVWVTLWDETYRVTYRDGKTGVARFLQTDQSIVGSPEINDLGDVAWSASMHVYLYAKDLDIVTQLDGVDSPGGAYPKINDRGDVVWAGEGNIFLYDRRSGITTQITTGEGNGNPQIDNKGEVVWENAGEIFFYSHQDGIVQLTESPTISETPVMNNKGQVAYTTWDWENVAWQIVVLDLRTGISSQLTQNSGHDESFAPQINDRGDVIWQTWTSTSWEISLFDSSEGRVIDVSLNETDVLYNTYSERAINDRGDIVWFSYSYISELPNIMFYRHESGAIQNIDSAGDLGLPSLNNVGDVVWAKDSLIYLMSVGRK